MALDARTSQVVDHSVGLAGLAGGTLGLIRTGRVAEGHRFIQDLGKTAYPYFAREKTIIEVVDGEGAVLRAYRYPDRWLRPNPNYFQILDAIEVSAVRTVDDLDHALRRHGLRRHYRIAWYRRTEFLQFIELREGGGFGNLLQKATRKKWDIKGNHPWRSVLTHGNHFAMAHMGLMAVSAIDIGVSFATGRSMVGHLVAATGRGPEWGSYSELISGLLLASVGGWKGAAGWGVLLTGLLAVQNFSHWFARE